MNAFHFAAQNQDLVAFQELLQGKRGATAIAISECDLCGKTVALSWEDECGWNFLALNAWALNYLTHHGYLLKW